MKLKTVLTLAGSGQLGLIRTLTSLSDSLYRAAFVATAAKDGVLGRLADGPVQADGLLPAGASEASRGALEAWLDVGVGLGELTKSSRGYALKGALSKALAEASNDAVAALLEEAVGLHLDLLRRTPSLARTGKRFTLADQDGTLIARSSRVLEPFVREAVDSVIPATGSVHLLEIGCGSGTYIRHAAERNTSLRAVGLELQPDVAAAARDNLSGWKLSSRVTVQAGDVREFSEGGFDVATMHNNIYYFPVDTRVALLKHVRGLLKPGGRFLLTTGCRGGTAAMEVLSLWGAATEGCGPLPAPAELKAQLEQAGFTKARAKRLIPVESYYAFIAERS